MCSLQPPNTKVQTQPRMARTHKAAQRQVGVQTLVDTPLIGEHFAQIPCVHFKNILLTLHTLHTALSKQQLLIASWQNGILLM